MLAVSESKIMYRTFILLARYNMQFIKDIFIPEMEENIRKDPIALPEVIAYFRENQFAENSLYFHHSYAYADIPMGQTYDVIARMEKGKIQADSVRRCQTKVLCFFSNYKSQPMASASHGHHESSLIRFEEGIPDLIDELYEIKEKKPLKQMQNICLCSLETLQANDLV